MRIRSERITFDAVRSPFVSSEVFAKQFARMHGSSELLVKQFAGIVASIELYANQFVRMLFRASFLRSSSLKSGLRARSLRSSSLDRSLRANMFAASPSSSWSSASLIPSLSSDLPPPLSFLISHFRKGARLCSGVARANRKPEGRRKKNIHRLLAGLAFDF